MPKKTRRFEFVLQITTAVAAALIIGAIAAPFRVVAQGQTRSPSSAGEGITVHGDWTIDVRNPDGTLAEHREFKNSLEPGGADLLVKLLLRERTVGYWYVHLIADANRYDSCGTTAAPAACYVFENHAGENQFPQSHFWTLSRRLIFLDYEGKPSEVITNRPAIQLKGTVIAGRTGRVNFVSSNLKYCGNTVTPNQCAEVDNQSTLSSFTFTVIKNAAGVATPIEVVAEQTIDVKVIFSFS